MTTFFQNGNDGKRETLIVTRPPHFPTMHTRETVTHLVAFGLDENQIAAVLKCTPDDVRTHYAEELEHGLARVNARVMSAVLHAALYNDSAPDRKLWLTNKAGWKGDGAKALAINANGGVGPDGETLTVVQRREVITKLLVKATQHKRQQERVIDVTATPVAKSTNGNGANGSNGHANGNGHGHGNGAGNGTKHR